MKKFLFALIISSLWQMSAGQDQILYCGQTEARERLFSRFPQAAEEARQANEANEHWNEEDRGGNDVYIIPVVFHIIHNNGAENISDEQVLDAITILNRDYRLLNEDQEDVVPEFQGLMADVEVEFRIAGLDPDGNCTSGINRVESDLTYEGDDVMKSLIYWPRNSYMNVWVCADAAGAAGYTNLPGDVNGMWAAPEDGIVIRADYVGSIGTSSIGHSRVLTHEVGHWLNLYHTWGSSNSPGSSSNCNMDDFVGDTPNTIGWSSCNLSGSSCNSTLDNVQNYMEYSYCTRMFTSGQRTRMRNALTSNVAQRNQLWTPANLLETGTASPVLCAALFDVDRSSLCLGEAVQFTDHSYHGVTTWSWDFGDGTTLSGSDPAVHQNPLHEYMTSGYFTVVLTVSNGIESVSTTVDDLISVITPGMNAVPLIESFEDGWPNDDWYVYNQNNDYTWELATNAAYTGSNSIKIRNFNNFTADNVDELISATFDLSNEEIVWLSYKWAYANKLNETDDRLRISVSGDCGSTWYLKKVHKGLTDLPSAPNTNAQFTPTGIEQWNSNILTLDNEDWLTDLFRVKFEFVGKGGNNIYLDDINLYGMDGNGVISPIAPVMAFVVYPNPASNTMTVDLNIAGSTELDIRLYDGLGRVCQELSSGTVSAGSHQFVLSHQSAGIYTLMVRDSNGIQSTRKVVFR